jgi:hypothetical protein
MTSPNETASPATPATVILLDPTSGDGEQALARLDDRDDRVCLVVLLAGRHSSALRDFARAEEIDLATAGWIYLEQVAERIARPSRTVELLVATGPDTSYELASTTYDRPVREIVIPPSVVRADPTLPVRLARWSDTMLVVAELVDAPT